MQQRGGHVTRRAVLGGSIGLLGLLAAGCTQTKTPSPGGSTSGPSGRRITLETPAVSGGWDPVAASDLEAQRITRQVYDRLIGLNADSGKLAPSLALSWESSDDALTYTFVLRQDVTFSDGTPFDADAVVVNMRRWQALASETGADVSEVSTLFDAAKDPGQGTASEPRDQTEDPATPSTDPSNNPSASTSAADPDPAPIPQLVTPDPLTDPYAKVKAPIVSIKAVDTHTVELVLERPLTPLAQALTHPAFSIVAPSALKAAGALNGRSTKDTLRRSAVGTGPFTAAMDGQTVVLTARPGHFSGEIGVDEVRLTPVVSTPRRAWDLKAKASDGFDLVSVEVLKDLVVAAMQVSLRDPFAVTYVGLNRANSWLADDRVRRAIAHAIDRGALSDLFNSSTKTALSPLASSLGVAEPVTHLAHDKDKARRLLTEAGYDGERIPFLFPTEVSRPYLPLPERTYAKIAGMLAAVGLNVKPVPMSWDEGYFDAVRSGQHAGLHLLGIQGTYRDPENFLGPLFSHRSTQFNYDSPELRRRLRVARTLPDGEARQQAYADIVELLAVDLPLIPLMYPISSLALGPRIAWYPVSPVLDEPLASIKLA